ncbi:MULTISPECIES: tRNA (adenosine(37)-N6)-threonylcarbamoyltransferase complex ATPase subunit type 1 TsaE [unclassified Myroides]|uniref:tRNA (adenosine(37)-N6)-threonylcarbamoyltransferase complex ATPase subunit type 1 TsaE n=1 Tax=unclassified Myroides TaxID=2642485 RepID=UPI0015FDFAE1|nr:MULTISPECIES: tRNA (adenosine(37)-N6)-threonylcarbamoyltransferase complex ATPase subunit type 1 TsaE [unclassified Myroides]MBB1149486.1 tRNA (adenosine(37)-N6)-threonylcarbamoyltransferase complex ATPase subunit type 1 TsaE [Myroides sp. NP-2]MDM1406605.1 tRNA (adenosine(37)-N6)-threonylcarbamoyltransferase complex ATPase subunit type 1 TsaE [Myroides sp. DF42-4-2]
MEFIYQLEEIDKIAAAVLPLLTHKIVLFEAPMGAGKTTFIKALAKQLKITDMTSSPTFSIVNAYQIPESTASLYHFDLYRLEEEEEAYDFGFEEYLDSGNWCFIEWPEKTPNLIPDHHSIIQIEVVDTQVRKLIITNA